MGRPVVYTSPGGDVCSILLRESLDVRSAGWQTRTCKHTTTRWQILAGMRVDWILATDFAGRDVSVVEKGVSVELTKRESAEYWEKLVSNDISLRRCGLVNRILVDAEFRVDGEVYCLDFMFGESEYKAEAARRRTADIVSVYNAMRCAHKVLGDRDATVLFRDGDWPVTAEERAFCRSRGGVYPNNVTDNCLAVDKGSPSPEVVEADQLVSCILDGRVHCLITCDLRVADDLRDYFEPFASIIKHAVVTYDDIGPFMQGVVDQNGIRVGERRCVIDSYVGKEVTMVDDYFRWLLEHGVVFEGIHQFVRYKRRAVLGPFRDDITQLIILGDGDRSSEIRALTTKLIGNSAFGSCITNKGKHRHVPLSTLRRSPMPQGYRSTEECYHPDLRYGGFDIAALQTKRSIASLNMFIRYEQISPFLLEVERQHMRVVYDQMRQIGKMIFDLAKLSLLRFVYDFVFRVCGRENVILLQTDTDSMYMGMQYEMFEENIVDMPAYLGLRDQYLVSERLVLYGMRTPNRYKSECDGRMMVCLCSKSYCVYDGRVTTSGGVKFSCKGIQKRNFVTRYREEGEERDVSRGEWIFREYDRALSAGVSGGRAHYREAVNRGLKN